MVKRRWLFLLGTMLFWLPGVSQDTIPMLKGKVKLSITKGTMECDFTLSDMPSLEDYVIRLNAGMNIFYFKDLDYNNLVQYEWSFTDTMSTGETKAYYFPAGNDRKTKFLPRKMQVRYVGMYPVIPEGGGVYSAEDWKGNLAFNGSSLRVDGRQSAWYPVLYDVKHDRRYDELRYDVEVECADCNALYINGSLPVKGTRARFKSDIPYQLTMFSGKYDVVNLQGSYFLNPDLNKQELSKFAGISNAFKTYLQQRLLIPYKGNPVYIQTTPTSEKNAWLFVSYPTIVNIGRKEYGMRKFIEGDRATWARPYIAHELGHYYFGTYKVFNSVLGDMMSEGFSEFLAFKITKDLISDSVYRARLRDKAKMIADFEAIPFSKVRSKADYKDREFYVYYYAPIIFLAIEKEIGEDRMWKWLNVLLHTKTVFTDYTFLAQALRTAIGDDQLFEQVEQKYFLSSASVRQAVDKLQIN